MDTWRDMGHMSNLSELDKKGLKKIIFGQKTPNFWSGHGREGEKKKRKKKSKLLSSIYEVSSVKIHRTKNESSSTRQGLCVGTKNMGFC